MALAPHLKRAKKERQAIYFDLICGAISSIIALIGLVFVMFKLEIERPAFLLIGFIFWICYLCFAAFLICFGVYLRNKENNIEKKKSKKKIRAPIV